MQQRDYTSWKVRTKVPISHTVTLKFDILIHTWAHTHSALTFDIPIHEHTHTHTQNSGGPVDTQAEDFTSLWTRSGHQQREATACLPRMTAVTWTQLPMACEGDRAPQDFKGS